MSEENKNIPEDPKEDSLEQEEVIIEPQETASELNPENYALFDDNATEKETKPPRRISLFAFVCSAVALVLAAVMLTYTVCSSVYQKKLAEARLENVTTGNPSSTSESYSELDILHRIFETYSFEELDEDAIREQLLKAYVAATGDAYAEYYTDEEYKALTAEMAGESQGIGINIINSTVEINGYTHKALKVINVIKNSPAEKSGVCFGDYIVAVGTPDEHTTVTALNYDMALKELQGVKGTVAEFLAYRPNDGITHDFSIMRDEFTTTSVMYKKVEISGYESVGLIKILSFDATTPTQLSEAVDTLKSQNCDKFAFDVRYNPGGELSSIVAVLSYFLDEGDTVISVKDNQGNEEITKVAPTEGQSCNVSAEDIGKYKDLNMVVLCNESTASAAELFVANFRDHELGTVIGTTTFGKGSMQSYMSLAYFGIEGVLKLTTRMYFPPNGESYEGEGIEPDVVKEQSEAAMEMSIYDIMGTDDDAQLVEAIKHFK